MRAAGRDRNDVGEAGYLNRRAPIRIGTISQLACAVIPQAQTVPSFFSARLCTQPADTAFTPLKLDTATGVLRVLVLPSPNCPVLLYPRPSRRVVQHRE